MLADRRFIVALMFTLLLSGSRLWAEPDDRPVDFSPASNVDENLFVLRALAHEYNLWPQDPWDGKSALKYCEEGRLHVKFLRSIAVKDQLDKSLCTMCDDFTTLMDDYEDSLAQLGDIDSKARGQAIQDALNTFVVGAAKALKAGADADADGASKLQVDGVVAKGLLDDGLKVYIEHSRARDQDTNTTVEAERSRFDQVLTFAMERNKKTVQGLTERLHWADGEGGFDMPAGTGLDVLAARRPRDPFAKMDLAAQGVDEKTSAAELINRARMCVDAARLIPAGETFDFYRIQCMAQATTYACNAAEPEMGQAYHDVHTQYSQEAINIAQSMLQANPQDPDAWVHVELFRAYSSAGRLDEAVTAAQPALDSPWKDRLAFTIRYAQVMGARGDAEQLEHWLRVSYGFGFSDLDLVKKSADFDCLRAKKPDVYAELTTVKGYPYISMGLVNDDMVLKNKSPFPMTNITVKMTVIKGGQIWKRERTFPFVAANSEETMLDVFMIPDSRYDSCRWTITSDQGNLSSEADGQ